MEYFRMRWLESAFGLTEGTVIKPEISSDSGMRNFAGCFASDRPFGDQSLLGAVPLVAESAIYLNSSRLRDPLSQYAAGLHEFYHLTKPYSFRNNDPVAEMDANRFAVDVLSLAFGRELAECVLGLAFVGALSEFSGLSGLRRMLEQSPNPHHHIVADQLGKFLVSQIKIHESGKILRSRS